MEIPASRWLEAITRRRSRRRFDFRPLQETDRVALQTLCDALRPFPTARAALIAERPDQVFKGAVGPYGQIKGAPACMAFIGEMDDPYVQERTGYLGEAAILEATALGLSTCWVAGFYRPEVAATLAGARGNEKVLAVSPVGYAPGHWSLEERMMAGFGWSHSRKPLADLVSGLDEGEWPPWAKVALEAGRLAPSAVNRQPWRFRLGIDSITISVDRLQDSFHISRRLDCGIAMLHLEVGLVSCGLRGRWEFLDPPHVARLEVMEPRNQAADGSSDGWSL